MSRIAKKPIIVPAQTEVTNVNGTITVKGPLGSTSRYFKPVVQFDIAPENITLTPNNQTLETLALWGTYAAHLRNMIAGVHTPFQKKLIVEGIGFKSDVKGKELVMSLGFSHIVKMNIPEGLKVTAEKNIITVSGLDIEAVGQFVAQIRAKKKPEPYKGKGIRYENEVIRRKQGKKSV